VSRWWGNVDRVMSMV